MNKELKGTLEEFHDAFISYKNNVDIITEKYISICQKRYILGKSILNNFIIEKIVLYNSIKIKIQKFNIHRILNNLVLNFYYHYMY